MLVAGLDAALDGDPSVTLLVGEAGVGKTRLARQLAADAHARGITTLLGECVELSGGDVPYGPLAAALRDVDPDVMAAAIAELPAAAQRQLAQAFPGVPAPQDGVDVRDDFTQALLFGWLVQLLARLSASAPLLLTIEDLQWADVSTRDFLLFLCQQMRSERLCVLVTMRTTDLPAEHPARAAVSRLAASSRVAQLELGPLSRTDIEELAQGILGARPTSGLAERLFQRGEGNPFYTEELLLAGGADRGDELPPTLREALMRRVRMLPPAARQPIRVLAATTGGANHRLIEDASGSPRGAMTGALREAVERHLLVCEHETGVYRFRHDLLRAAVYADLHPTERADVHRAIATALAARGASAAERAYHWDAAEEPIEAVLAAVDAGLAAERVYAHAEALTQFDRAMRLWPDTFADHHTPTLDPVDLRTHAANAARWAGDMRRGAALCREALSLLDEASEPVRAADVYERLGWCGWNMNARLKNFERALDLLPMEEVERRLRLQADTATALSNLSRFAEATRVAEEALLEARVAGARQAERRAEAELGLALAFVGDLSAGEQHLRTAVRLSEDADDPRGVLTSYVYLGELMRVAGRIEDALAIMDDGVAIADRRGATALFGNYLALNAADDLWRLGRWDELEDRLRPLLRTAPPLGRDELVLHTAAGALAAARGETEASRSLLDHALTIFRDQWMPPAQYAPSIFAPRAELELWRGDPTAARGEVAEGLRSVDGEQEILYSPLLYAIGTRVEADAAEQARAEGKDEAAQAAVQTADELRHQLMALLSTWPEGGPPEAAAHAANCRAEIARAAGHSDPELWAAAAAAWRALAAPYGAAYALWRHAEALLQHKRRDDARQVLAEANEIAVRLRAVPLGQAITTLARSARVPLTAIPVSPVSEGGQSPVPDFGLTNRESEVLALLANGLTNRQISERLYISHHTAGVHVSHILAKLGVSNRVKAAAAAQRLGLLKTS